MIEIIVLVVVTCMILIAVKVKNNSKKKEQPDPLHDIPEFNPWTEHKCPNVEPAFAEGTLDKLKFLSDKTDREKSKNPAKERLIAVQDAATNGRLQVSKSYTNRSLHSRILSDDVLKQKIHVGSDDLQMMKRIDGSEINIDRTDPVGAMAYAVATDMATGRDYSPSCNTESSSGSGYSSASSLDSGSCSGSSDSGSY